MTDYAVKITVRNGRILRRMRERGINTLRELADKSGMGYSRLCAVVALTQRPTAKSGWAAGIEDVAGVLMCDVDDLFTDAQRDNVLETNSREIYMSEPEVMALASGDMERATGIKLEVERLLLALPDDRVREARRRIIAIAINHAAGLAAFSGPALERPAEDTAGHGDDDAEFDLGEEAFLAAMAEALIDEVLPSISPAVALQTATGYLATFLAEEGAPFGDADYEWTVTAASRLALDMLETA